MVDVVFTITEIAGKYLLVASHFLNKTNALYISQSGNNTK